MVPTTFFIPCIFRTPLSRRARAALRQFEGDCVHRDPAIMPPALDASIGLIELVPARELVSRLSDVNRRGLPFYPGRSVGRLAD